MLTALGEVELRRDYFSGTDTSFPADARLGILDRLTPRARKITCLFGTGWGFSNAAEHLRDVCGWQLSSQSIRRYCYIEASRIEQWRERTESGSAFAEAEGDVEFLTDGTMVNTLEEGWKEIRIAAFLKRPAGQPARVHQWSSREIPATSARSVCVEMASAEEFAASWREWAARLGITMTAMITVLADGAKWIWNQASQQFPSARGVLDIFHVLQHVADATRNVYGEGSGISSAWKDAALRALLSDGWLGLCDWVGRWRDRCDPEHAKAVRAVTEALLGYLSNHSEHLGYCERLAKGKSIGSGPIEGACKHIIGRRLKRTGARWRRKSAVKMGTLCSTHYAGDWQAYWKACPVLAI